MHKILCMIVLMMLSATAFADTPLTGDQIKQLVSGNSIDLHSNANGLDLKLYLAADGSIAGRREDNGNPFKGTWRITDSGEFCSVFASRKETCGPVMDSGDGSYKRMEEGYPRAIWKKIHPGNAFGL